MSARPGRPLSGRSHLNELCALAHSGRCSPSQSSTNSEDSHFSIGAGINFGSDGIGYTANIAMGEGELDREGVQHHNSTIDAGKKLTIKSGSDTTIAGGNVSATDVDMDIGGNLTVASVQDTGQATGERWDMSASITVGAGGSFGASVGYGETEGSKAWVNEQTSIIGSGSVKIRTEGHTQIDGAVIANIDKEGNDKGNLVLDTGSLGYSDIEDHDKEKSYYLNVGFSTGDNKSTNQTESGNNYSASGNYSNYDKAQINRATVGNGTVTVRNNAEQDISDLNRDTTLAQEVTKDSSTGIDLYATTTALDSLGELASDPSKQLGQWKDNVASVASSDAWGKVAGNVTEAGQDVANTYSALKEKDVLGFGTFAEGLDANHKITQLKNDLQRTEEGLALLEKLKSDDPDERLAAQAQIGNLAQTKFGIDPGDILFYSEAETDSASLKSTALADIKGGTVIEQGHDEYGNIFVNIDKTTDAKDMANTVGHEVYETVTQQTGGVNDATQEVIAGMVGSQLANRLDNALGGTLGSVGTGGLAGSATVQYGNTRADNVGNAQVDYRQLQSKEMQAIKAMAPQMAEKEGISVAEAEKRMAEELVGYLDASWSNSQESAGRESDAAALNYLAHALVSLGDNYDVARSDIPIDGMAAPRADNDYFTTDEVKDLLSAYKDNHADKYNNRTQDGKGLTNPYSEQSQFYNTNLGADKSLSDVGNTALGALAGGMDTGADVTQGLLNIITNPLGVVEGMSLGLQGMLNDPLGVISGAISGVFNNHTDGQINAVLNGLQGDPFGAGRTGMSTELGFMLDLGVLPIGRVSGVKGLPDTPTDTTTYYRVEGGGSGAATSQNRIAVNQDGSVSINSGCSGQLCVSTGNAEHASYFLTNKRPDGSVVVFEIDNSLHNFIMEEAVPQRPIPGVTRDPNAPKIVDDSKPGTALELPKMWNSLIEEHSSKAKVYTQEEFLKRFGNGN